MTALVDTETGEMIEPKLNDIERGRLAREESSIEAGAAQIGAALAVIRDQRLYRETHSTFEAYCLERWGITHRYANYQISATEVRAAVGTIVPESQARELAPLLNTPEVLAEVWQAAYAETAGKPTAAAIREVRERLAPTDTPEPRVPPVRPAQRRASLPDSYFHALHDMKKKAESLMRLTQDDRYAANRAAVTGRHHSEALRALLTVGAAVTQLDPATLAASEEARQWWLASLNEITDALHGFGSTLKEI